MLSDGNAELVAIWNLIVQEDNQINTNKMDRQSGLCNTIRRDWPQKDYSTSKVHIQIDANHWLDHTFVKS